MMDTRKEFWKHDQEYIDMAEACGVYGTDRGYDILEFAYLVAQHTRKEIEKERAEQCQPG